MSAKVYILYARPFKNEDDEPPVSEVWSDGERPPKRKMNSETLFVYDVEGKYDLVNERAWDGEE